MSSTQIRTAARTLMADPSWPAPAVETVAENPDPSTLPDLWSSVQFSGERDDPVGIGPGSLKREEGSVSFAFFAQSSRGDTAALQAAELAEPLIRAWPWGVGVFIRSLTAPDDAVPAGDGNWYQVDLTMEYHREH